MTNNIYINVRLILWIRTVISGKSDKLRNHALFHTSKFARQTCNVIMFSFMLTQARFGLLVINVEKISEGL